MNFVQTICSPSLDDFFQDDYNSGCRIIECLILYSDNYLSYKIEELLALLPKTKDSSKKILLVGFIV